MTIAHDSEVLGAANTAGPYTTAITPANPPQAVWVGVEQNGSTTDSITSVTFGGIALSRRRFDTEATEAGCVYHYWGATTFPSGTQNVVITRSGSDSMRAAIATMTCAAGMTVGVDSDATGSSASVANPSWVHTSLAADVAAYLVIHSGLNAMTSTPATGWTLAPSPGFEDIGTQGRGWARRTLATPGALAPGWTAGTADDFVGSSIAFKEVPLAAGFRAPLPYVVGRAAVRRAALW